MNRSDGLTKRNVAKKKDEASGFSEDGKDWGDWDHVDDDDLRDEEKDDHESKQMKFTLMEEVLLLGLKDREVCMIIISFSVMVIQCQTVQIAYKVTVLYKQ